MRFNLKRKPFPCAQDQATVWTPGKANLKRYLLMRPPRKVASAIALIATLAMHHRLIRRVLLIDFSQLPRR
jgi:hypothetical protein